MWVIWPFPFLLFAIAIHAVYMRVWIGGNSVIRFVFVSGFLGLALLVLLVVKYGFNLQTFAALAAFLFLCELYIFVFTLVLSSISAKVLILLYTRRVSVSELEAMYDTSGMVERRLKRLIAVGFLGQKENKWQLTGKGRRLIRIFAMLQRFFGHPAL